MSRVRPESAAIAICPACGTVTVPVSAVTVAVLDSTAHMVCPGCGDLLEKPLTADLENLLFAAGCRLILR